MNPRILPTLLSAALACFAQSACGGTLSIPATRTGWYEPPGLINPTRSSNYYTGGTGDTRSFFVFDLSDLAQPGNTLVSSASLEIYSGTVALWATHTVSLGLFEISSPNDLWHVAYSTDLYDDLGAGMSYGKFSYSTADQWGSRSLALNQEAVADINRALTSADATFAIGGRLVSATSDAGSRSGYLFGRSETVPVPTLLLSTYVVPEPMTLTATLLAAACVGLHRRRR